MAFNKQMWRKVTSIVLIMCLWMGSIPPISLSIFKQQAVSAATDSKWISDPNETETAKYYSGEDTVIFEKMPELDDERGGAGGEYLKMEETKLYLEGEKNTAEFKWTDHLQDWINDQEGEPINAPTGYIVDISLKNVVTNAIIPIKSGIKSVNGLNKFSWNGKDSSGLLVPEGSYVWQLSAPSLTVDFEVKEGEKTKKVTLPAPTYSTEFQRIAIDRTKPEIVAIHPIGGNRIAVEARDSVSGLKKIEISASTTEATNFKETPLHASYSAQIGTSGKMTVVVTNGSGQTTEETLPLNPFTSETGNADYLPQAEGTVAGQEVQSNLPTGNGYVTFEGFTQKSTGLDVGINLTYNHQNRIKGTLGYGFNIGWDSRFVKWSTEDITWADFDGTVYWFTSNGKDYTTYVNGQQQKYPILSTKKEEYTLTWSNHLQYHFTKDGRLKKMEDRFGNQIDASWEETPSALNGDYRISTLTDTEGRKISFSYDDVTGKLTTITGISNRTGMTAPKVRFLYNKEGKLIGFVQPSGKIIRFVYDELQRMIKVIDDGSALVEEEGIIPTSVVSKWIYDDKNRVTRISMARKSDNKEEFLGIEYGSNSTKVSEPLGAYTIRMNSAHRLTEREEKVNTLDGNVNAKTTYEYSRNNLIQEADPLGRTNRYRYNEYGDKIAEQSSSGRIITYSYDADQDLTREEGPLGYDIKYTYAKNGNKITSITTTKEAVDPSGVNKDKTIITKEEYNTKGQPVKITDGNGNDFTYTYDTNGFLTSDGTNVSYLNDKHGNLTKEVHDEGTEDSASTLYTYNGLGLLTKKESSTGLIEQFEYDTWGRITKLTQTDKNKTSQKITTINKYNESGHLIEESNGLLKANYTVDAMGNLLSKITVPVQDGAEGKTTESYIYDRRGLLISQTDSYGATTEIVYNAAEQPVQSVIKPDAYKTTYSYDEAGRQKEVINPDGGRTQFEYDKWDRVIKEKQIVKTVIPNDLPVSSENIQEETLTTELRYDSLGRVVEEKSPNKSWNRYVYDGNDHIIEELVGGKIPTWNGTTLESGKVDSLYTGHEILSTRKRAFDKLGRIVSETDGNGNKTTYSYNGRKTITKFPALDENGKETTYTETEVVDPNGNVVKKISPSGESVTFMYDAFGNEIGYVNEEGQRIDTGIDAFGRISQQVEMIDSSGRSQKTSYVTNAWGQVTEEKRQLNETQWATTKYYYTPFGEVREIIDPSGLITKYMYDKYGRTTEMKEIDGGIERATTYAYDSVGRATNVTQPDGSKSVSVYNTLGQEVLAIDGVNNAQLFRYDGIGNIAEIVEYKDGATTLGDSTTSARTKFVYDGFGNVVLQQDPNKNVVRALYDEEGNTKTVTYYANESMTGEKIVSSYRYDPRGLVVSFTDGNGNTTKYGYDEEGQQISETAPDGQWLKYEYSPSGYLIAERRPMGRSTEWKYDYRGVMLEEKDALGNTQRFDTDIDGRTIVEYNRLGEATRYTYDLAGQVVSKATPIEGTYTYQHDTVGNKRLENRPIYGSIIYDYDKRDNLTKVTEPLNGGVQTEYGYDGVQNRISQKDGNAQLTTYDYDEASRRTQKIITRPESGQEVFSYQYDPNGNLILETKPGGLTTRYTYDFMNRVVAEEYSNGTSFRYTYDDAGNVLTRTSKDGTITYKYDANNNVIGATYPNGDVIEYEYNENGEPIAEIINGVRTEVKVDDLGRPTSYTDTKGYKYEYEYDAEGYIKAIKYPNGLITSAEYKPNHLLDSYTTKRDAETLYTSKYQQNARDFITNVLEQQDSLTYAYDDREQLNKTVTKNGDIILYEYDGAGNRTVRKTIIQGAVEDKQKVITIDKLVMLVLGIPESEIEDSETSEDEKKCGNNGKHNGQNQGNSSGNGHGNANGCSGKDNGKGNSNGKGNANALENGQGKKLGLYKKLEGVSGGSSGTNPGTGKENDWTFETGQIEKILAAIDNIVNGEVNLPQGEHTKLFERIREVGKGYTVIGTNYTYNERNQLIHRSNEVRMEEYDYNYDGQGNLTSNGRSKYEWNDRGQLTKVIFPDGFGEMYKYDNLGRRIYKAQLNHKGKVQTATNYHYKGDTWIITEETDKSGKTTKSYTFDPNDRPLTITYKDQTFWYVYNGHGDVVALTDKDGKVVARYEYDEWGIVTRMYNRYGERVREGIGWIGDLGTGDGSPGSIQGPADESGNTNPDYHPGIGNDKSKNKMEKSTAQSSIEQEDGASSEPISEIDSLLDNLDLSEETPTPTEDISTELVKENPFRYAGYYYDRKTQYYYLQARYYDPRLARFISEDTYEGEIEQPITLNQYTYANNNPVMYIDPTGHMAWHQIDDLLKGIGYSIKGSLKDILYSPLAIWELGTAIAKGKVDFDSLAKAVKSTAAPFKYVGKHAKKVWANKPKKPTDKEVVEYGRNLGSVLQSFVGSTAAIGIIAKAAPKLAKFLKKGGCNCFVAGTKVLTDEGEKNIEDIEVGDRVLSKNEETGEQAYKEVTHLYRNDKEIIYELTVGDQVIETTDNHPFWVEGEGWVLASDLQVGDELQQSDGNTLTIDTIKIVKHDDERVEVYNFTVADFNTYFVSELGIWVHNIGPCEKLPSQGKVSAVNGAPPVDAGKQGKHVPGHPNNVSTKSQWPVGQNGVELTQLAWQSGTVVKPDGSVKIWNSGKVRVKVHIDGKGNLHGYPVN